jgi:uridylate kinase
MDSTALTFCMDNNIPIVVFDLSEPGSAARIVAGDRLGTLVSNDPSG